MKKTFKKLLVGMSCTILTTSMLAGCGNSSNQSNGEVVITYSIWDKIQEQGMREMADAFEVQNPGIKVNVEVTPWDQYWTKLEAAATGGALPDVFWMHSSQSARYAQSNILMNLTDKVKESNVVDLSKFPQGLVELYTIDGQTYALPKDIDTIGLWFNKTLFDEAGVEYPNETWTWDTLLEAAKTLTDKEKGVYGISAPLNTQEGLFNYVYQNGGDVFTDNKTKSGYSLPETREALQWYVNLSLVEEVSPLQSQFAENSPATFFTSGKTAMAMFGSWMLNEFSSNEYTSANCDVAVLPAGSAGHASIYNGLGNAVAANTKQPEAAWKFVEFMGTYEANEIQAKTGAAIPAYEGTAQIFVEATSDVFNTQVFTDMIEYSKIKPYTKNTAKWENAEMEILRKVWAGQLSVDEACDQLVTEIEIILAQE
ncbi:MAG: ABC transporter substrate-binding protein [Turicibacter sp.]